MIGMYGLGMIGKYGLGMIGMTHRDDRNHNNIIFYAKILPILVASGDNQYYEIR